MSCLVKDNKKRERELQVFIPFVSVWLKKKIHSIFLICGNGFTLNWGMMIPPSLSWFSFLSNRVINLGTKPSSY